MWAAHENNAPAITTLLAAGAERDARSTAGDFSALLFAVRAGAVDATRALLDAGADANETLLDGTSALVLAATNAHYEVAARAARARRRPERRGARLDGAAPDRVVAPLEHGLQPARAPRRPASSTASSSSASSRRAAPTSNARQTKEPADGNRNKLDRLGATRVPARREVVRLAADASACSSSAPIASLTTNAGTTAVMAAAGVGIWAPGENPGTHAECLAAVKLALDAGGGDVNAIDANGETAMHGAVYRGGNIPVIQFLADRGAKLDVVNSKGWTPVSVADGVEYTPDVLKRYPEAAALLRSLLAERGLPVPPSTQPGR